MDKAQILAHRNERVPRYTSYPTAPHFRPADSPGDYEARLPDVSGPVSVYLHVPYCRTLCWYCGCHTRATKVDTPVRRYAAALRAEIALIGNRFAGRPSMGHLHWGGGTPTILPPDDFAAIADALDRVFMRTADAEVAVEIDPRVVTPGHVAAFRRTGVTRASLGVQSFDAAVQAAINRVQPFDVTAQATDWLRAEGIDAISLDLVCGLPHQTVTSMAATVDRSLELAPDRVALFAYAHLPRLKRNQRLIPADALPDAAARLDQMLVAHDRLVAAGYRPIGMDHYARPTDSMARAADDGTLHRNFQGYTTDTCTPLIGFGASAIGAFDDLYVQNTADIRTYLTTVERGSLPIARQCRLTQEDRLRRAVIEALMTDLAVDVERVGARFGTPPTRFASEYARLQGYRDRQIVAIDGWRITVNPDYRPLLRSIASVFDAYLAAQEQRHATAV